MPKSQKTDSGIKVVKLEVCMQLFNYAENGGTIGGCDGHVIDMDRDNNIHIVHKIHVDAQVGDHTCKAYTEEDFIQVLMPKVGALA